ncbi:MAG TPA: hypothetical protein VIY47_06250 [Ignavibacteriaceae bacterium]
MKLTQRRIKTATLVTIFLFIGVVYLALATCSRSAYGQSVKPPKTDTVPPKTYTLTYDRNFLSVHLDSLLRYGSQFIGTELSKTNYFEVMAIYNRIVFRIVQSGKLDSLAVKK